MFKKQAKQIHEVLGQYLRRSGLETPLLQHRVIDAWDEVVGNVVARYTTEKYIYNQTLHIKIVNPAVRNDLLMRRTELIKALNEAAGGNMVISDIRIH